MLPKILFYVFLAADVLFILTVISFWLTNKTEAIKWILFTLIVIVTLSLSGYLIYYTVNKNLQSLTAGPVHWHADFAIWACGQQIELVDPVGLSNKVGTDLLHEHNDERIHVEGIVKDYQDVSLGEFFQVTGGELTNNSLTVVTNDPPGMVKTYEECGGVPGELQVFVYRGGSEQIKVSDPVDYQISQESQVPPGDCIIIEFDAKKERTGKICRSYKDAH